MPVATVTIRRRANVDGQFLIQGTFVMDAAYNNVGGVGDPIPIDQLGLATLEELHMYMSESAGTPVVPSVKQNKTNFRLFLLGSGVETTPAQANGIFFDFMAWGR